jgi:hypothetical protein
MYDKDTTTLLFQDYDSTFDSNSFHISPWPNSGHVLMCIHSLDASNIQIGYMCPAKVQPFLRKCKKACRFDSLIGKQVYVQAEERANMTPYNLTQRS